MNIDTIKHELKTQDNRSTSHIFFVVEELRYIDGMDEEYADHRGYLDGETVIRQHDKEFEGLKYLYETEELPNRFTEVHYTIQWVPVQFCLTEKGAQAFINRKGHDYNKLRIYGYSAYYNPEIIAIRSYLMGEESK